MNLRQYLSIMAIGTAVSLSAWCIVVIAIDPRTAGGLPFAVFYFTLAGGLAGLLTILGTVIRARKHGEEQLSMAVARSFRQAVLLSLLVILSLYLMGMSLFSLPVLLVVIGGLGFIEFLFLYLGERQIVNEG